jgi:hypothetical protein
LATLATAVEAATGNARCTKPTGFPERREPSGKARAFEPPHRCGKSPLIRWQEIHAL